MKQAKEPFKYLQAVVFDPSWTVLARYKHPLKRNEVVYYMGLIPNVPGHCVVAKSNGKVVPMIHPEELRIATEDEL